MRLEGYFVYNYAVASWSLFNFHTSHYSLLSIDVGTPHVTSLFKDTIRIEYDNQGKSNVLLIFLFVIFLIIA